MAGIGSENVKVGVDMTDLADGLSRVETKLDQFRKKQKGKESSGGGSGLLGSFAKGGVIGAGFGVGLAAVTGMVSGFQSLVGSMKEFADRADATTKIARAFGLTTENLSGLQHAAGLAGVETEELTVSLKTLSNNIGEANSGSATAQKMFETLGLSASDLASLPLDESLGLIADKFTEIEDPAQRTKLALDLFGKSGFKMGELLAGGSQGLKEAVEEAKLLGISFNNIDASAIEKSNDALSRMSGAIGGVWQRMVVALAPTVQAIAEGVTGAFVKLSPVINYVGDVAKEVFEIMALAIQDVSAWIGELLGSWAGSVSEWPAPGEVATKVVYGIAKAIAYVIDTTKAVVGAFAVASGAIIKFGNQIITMYTRLFMDLGKLPDELGGGMFRKAGMDLLFLQLEIEKMGEGIGRWGEDAMAGFGHADMAVEQFFTKLEARRAEKRKQQMKEVVQLGKAVDKVEKAVSAGAAGAFTKGSSEALAIEAKFKTSGMIKASEDKLLAETKRANELKKLGNDLLGEAVRFLKTLPRLGVV